MNNGIYNVGTVGVTYWHTVAVRFPKMTMSNWPENVPQRRLCRFKSGVYVVNTYGNT